MSKRMNGFTLIEVMIVVAIIGILAALAFPAYLNHIARAEAAEGLKATKGIQTDIAAYYYENDAMPPAGSDVVNFALEVAGKYFDKGNVTVSADSGIIGVFFSKGSNQGSTLTLTPSLNPVGSQITGWVCAGLPMRRLPTTCQ